MSVGFNTSKGVSNVASMQNTNEVQQGSFIKNHTFSKGEGDVVRPSLLPNLISYSSKPLAQRSVSVAISRY